MKEQSRRLLTPALVIVGCIALLLVVIALASRSGSGEDSAAIGFPIVLVVLAGVSVVSMLVRKAVSKKSRRSSASGAPTRRRTQASGWTSCDAAMRTPLQDAPGRTPRTSCSPATPTSAPAGRPGPGRG